MTGNGPGEQFDLRTLDADATSLTGYEGRFDTVLDSVLYHCLDEEQRRLYATALHRATKPGALLNLLCFSDTTVDGPPAPLRVSAENRRTTLASAGWTVTDLRQSTISVVVSPDLATQFGHTVAVDEKGRTQTPAWAVRAHRREDL
ncbi:MAG: class I SAM-dependent methyltransferase [Pseudonocardiales bacterium]|nr:class I SAM-dependent methyltransferase [Pseudonocardiales bacterium]MBV9031366.1 class I SAM-dependent methyltransferase [Pseudonocardiales bacterium]MBW0011331.1 class I SAM-dependent methyltransferase [Pseudonocardiales bacterium]